MFNTNIYRNQFLNVLSDDLRRKVWPLMTTSHRFDRIPEEEITSHQYYNQVVLDVKRILKRFPPGKYLVLQLQLASHRLMSCMF